MPTTKFPVTTTSTLISHMDSGIRARNGPNMAVRATRNATRGGRNGVKTRSALTAGRVADFPDSPKTANAQSSKRRSALDTPRVNPHRFDMYNGTVGADGGTRLSAKT